MIVWRRAICDEKVEMMIALIVHARVAATIHKKEILMETAMME